MGGGSVADVGRAAQLGVLRSIPGVATASEVAAAEWEGVLPVRTPLAGVLPLGGLRRGSTVTVLGSTSVLLALLAAASAEGRWTAAVGMPDLGLLAATERGVELDRLALVPGPAAAIGQVVATCLDGMDLVAVAPAGVSAALARRLSARARQRHAVLLAAGNWPGADVDLRCTPGGWAGLDGGRGYLRSWRVEVYASGRGAAARPVAAELSFSGAGITAEPAAGECRTEAG
jgi:hypothetical protein